MKTEISKISSTVSKCEFCDFKVEGWVTQSTSSTHAV